MKILYFTDAYLPQINGLTRTLEKLHFYLEENSIQHMFFAPCYSKKNSKSANEQENVIRFKSIKLIVYPECRVSFPFYKNLCRLADRFKPDLIHLVTPFGIGIAGLKYARERNVPIVCSYHTDFSSHIKYYKLGMLDPILWKLLKWFHSFSIINFCPSNDTLKFLANKGFNNLAIWTRGINTEKFSPVHRNELIRNKFGSDKKILFLYVGRIAAEKDLDVLLSSILKVNKLRPETAEFIFVGDGPYKKKIYRISQKNVHYLGYMEKEKLSEIYASCDVFVFPSSTETFGNVIIEAMASGLPVIAVNSGGVVDNMLHEFNGLLCDPKDVDSFTASIIKFIDNRNLINLMGTNARAHTLNHTWQSVFSKLLSDYQNAVNIYIEKDKPSA